jgi:predicted phosphohydrolase
MALYAISDLHLSLSTDKSMEVFPGWENYVERIKSNWENTIKDEDMVVLPGDISWGMTLEQALLDFKFINSLPGKKIILKGNHDYWWTTRKKMENFFNEKGLHTLNILNNDCYKYEEYAVCGTRGWINENEEPADKKVLLREAGRLETSIKLAINQNLKPIVFLHYPPIYADDYNYDILEVLHKYKIKDCYYGHIHGKSSDYAINGERDGIKYTLISGDYLQFSPVKIK